jgi:prophage antirepressor-like protein
MSNLAVFQFESHEVRFVGTAIDPWWVAADVCCVLEIKNTRNAYARLDDDEKDVRTVDTLGGKQDMVCVNQSGLFSLILVSRKPQAKRFRKWVTSEVLPSIYKTGKYELPQAKPTTALSTIPDFSDSIAQESKLLPPTLQEISDLFDLTLGGAGLDSKLIAGVKLNAIASCNPALAEAAEIAKSALSIPIEEGLVRPTQLGEKLEAKTGEKWSAIRVNKLLTDLGFQIPNPDGKNPAYLPTEKGKEYSQLVLDTAKGRDKTVQSLQWHLSVLEALEANDH